MVREEALRAINEDQLDYIQKPVIVDFDTTKAMPLSFTVKGKRHEIGEILEQFRTRKELPMNAFLVRTNDNLVFFLYFHFSRFGPNRSTRKGCWILSFRILDDDELMAFYRRERKMIVNMALKRIADFHGHLCPDLVLGGKLCEHIQKMLPITEPANGIATIIAENCTSALDAIQIMLGTTMGNQRLKVMDLGKHNYSIIPKTMANSFRLVLNEQEYKDEDTYKRLSDKMLNSTILMDEVVSLQMMIDERVKHLLKQPPESLFRVEPIEREQQLPEVPSVYLTCCRCNEQVLGSHAVEYENQTYCLPCFRAMKVGNMSYWLQ
jgi:formylmethanofuran dehydrogenase subunit E